MWHIHWHIAFFGAMYLVLIQLQYCDIVKLRQGSGKDWQGMAVKQKASKLKPLPRAYIKVGYHPPTHPPPTTHRKSHYTLLMA